MLFRSRQASSPPPAAARIPSPAHPGPKFFSRLLSWQLLPFLHIAKPRPRRNLQMLPPPNLTRPSEVRALLAQLDFHPSRVLGQNFLIDRNILNILLDAAELVPGDRVVEVGPGLLRPPGLPGPVRRHRAGYSRCCDQSESSGREHARDGNPVAPRGHGLLMGELN